MICYAGSQRKKVNIIYGGKLETFNEIVDKQLDYQRDFTNEQVKSISIYDNSREIILKLQENLNNEFDTTMSKENFFKLLETWLDTRY